MRKWLAVSLAVASIIAIFLLDLKTPRGYGEWILYFIPIYLLFSISKYKAAYFSSAVITLLLIIGAIVSKSGVPVFVSIISKLTFSAAIWITLFVFVSRARTLEILKKTVQKLSDSQKWLEHIADTTPDIIFVHDIQEHINVYVNKSISDLLGYTMVEAKSKSFMERVTAESDKNKMVKFFDEMVDAKPGENRKIIIKAVHKDGSNADHEIRISPFTYGDNGKVKQVIGISRDISDLLYVQNELIERTALLDAAIDAIADALIIYNNNGMIIRTNSIADTIFYYNREDNNLPMIQRINNLHPKTKAGTPFPVDEIPSMRAISKGETIRNIELFITNSKGQSYLLNSSAAPIISKSGKQLGAVATFFDMTSFHKLESQREALLRETEVGKYNLEMLNKNLETIISKRTEQVRLLSKALTIAEYRERKKFSQTLHENLQQILFAIKIQLDQISNSGKHSDNSEEIQEGQRLTGKALMLTRTLSLELNPPVLNSQGLDAALSWLASHMKESYHLSVELNIDEKLKRIRDEPQLMLTQMVRELLNNVVKHSGVLNAKIEALCEKGTITISVIDKGKGFNCKETFLPEKSEIKLGLFSIEERLKLFGGSLVIQSKPGGGTRCTILLPSEYC